MLKQNLITSILIFGCSCLSAFEGFYVGGTIGGSDALGDQSGIVVGRAQFSANDQLVATTPLDLNGDAIHSRWGATGFAGYGIRWCGLFSGLEAFVRYSSDCDSIMEKQLVVFPDDPDIFQLTDTTRGCSSNWHFGFDYRPGIFLTPLTLLYGRVGVSWERVKLSTEAINSGEVPSEPQEWVISLSDSHSRKKAHLRLGIGIEQQLCSNLSLRLDYNYTDYGKISMERSALGVTTPGGFPTSITESKQLRLEDHALQVGLAYYFCPNCNTELYDKCLPGWKPFCGFYLAGAAGGIIGHSIHHGDVIGHSENMSQTPQTTLTVLPPKHQTTLCEDKSVYAGYGLQWKRLFAGIEAFGQYAYISRKAISQTTYLIPGFTTYTNTVRTRDEIKPWQFGLEVRPGILVTPLTLLYGTVGTSVATIKSSSNIFYNLESEFIQNGSLSLDLARKSTRATLRLGGGLEYTITPCIHVRADYIYTDYGKLNLEGAILAEVPSGNMLQINQSTQTRFSSHAATLGIVWYL